MGQVPKVHRSCCSGKVQGASHLVSCEAGWLAGSGLRRAWPGPPLAYCCETSLAVQIR